MNQPIQYQVIPVNPNVATVVPTSFPAPTDAYPPIHQAQTQTSAPPRPSPLPALIAVGAIGAVLVLLSQSGGQSIRDLEHQNFQLQQQNADLRNRVDQLEYQLLGIYSAQ